MTDPADLDEPPADPARVMRTLGLIFAGQLLAFVLLVVGGVLLAITVAHNNSLDCSGYGFPGTGTVSCAKRSYALPVGLLIGGSGLFVIGMFLSAQYALRHIGRPVLAAFLARRRYVSYAESRRDDPPSSTS